MNIIEDNYDKFIFKAPLAIEGFCDLNIFNKKLKKEIDNMYFELKKYRELKPPSCNDKNKIVKEIISVINLIGIDNFIIYDDGDIEYKA